jgi:hypothetical protein
MPYLPSLADRSTDPQLSPEMTLIAAVLRQAVKDLTSPYQHIRAEAERFWRSPEAVAYWSDICGCDLAPHVPPAPP